MNFSNSKSPINKSASADLQVVHKNPTLRKLKPKEQTEQIFIPKFSDKLLKCVNHYINKKEEYCMNIIYQFVDKSPQAIYNKINAQSAFIDNNFEFDIEEPITKGLITEIENQKRYQCKLPKHTMISAHIHFKGESLYPSPEDIMHTLMYDMKIEIVFVKIGFWWLENHNTKIDKRIHEVYYEELKKIYYLNGFHTVALEENVEYLNNYKKLVEKFISGYIIYFVSWKDYYKQK